MRVATIFSHLQLSAYRPTVECLYFVAKNMIGSREWTKVKRIRATPVGQFRGKWPCGESFAVFIGIFPLFYGQSDNDTDEMKLMSVDSLGVWQPPLKIDSLSA